MMSFSKFNRPRHISLKSPGPGRGLPGNGAGARPRHSSSQKGPTIAQTRLKAYIETGGNGGEISPPQTVFFGAATPKIWAPGHGKNFLSSPREKNLGHFSLQWSKNALKCV